MSDPKITASSVGSGFRGLRTGHTLGAPKALVERSRHPHHLSVDDDDIARTREVPSSILFLLVIFIGVWAENSCSHKCDRKEFSNENVTQVF